MTPFRVRVEEIPRKALFPYHDWKHTCSPMLQTRTVGSTKPRLPLYFWPPHFVRHEPRTSPLWRKRSVRLRSGKFLPNIEKGVGTDPLFLLSRLFGVGV